MLDKTEPATSVKKGRKKADPFDTVLTNAIDKAVDKVAKRSTEELFEKAEKMGVDPFTILLQIADGNKLALDLDDESDKPISPELRAMAARELLKFMYPTLKSAELTGANGAPLQPLAVRVLFGSDSSDAGD